MSLQAYPEVGLDEVKPLLAKLISIPSPSQCEHEIAEFTADLLRSMGANVSIVLASKCGPSVLAEWKFTGRGRTLLFYGHLDTVKPSQGWRQQPFKPRVEGDKVYGVGACDMKGGISALLAALRKLPEIESDLQGSLKLALVSDEEAYSRGFEAASSLNFFGNVDSAISVEPTGLKRLEVGRFGRIAYKVEVSSLNPKVNPIVEASKLISKVSMLSGRDFKASVIAIDSNMDLDSNPTLCKFVVDISFRSGSFKRVESRLRSLIRRAGLKADIEIAPHPRPTPYMEPYRLGGGEPIVSSLEKACLQVLGFKPRRVIGESAGDENYLANRFGIPTVTYGPDGGNIHGVNEYVCLSSVVKAANIYLRALTIFLRS